MVQETKQIPTKKGIIDFIFFYFFKFSFLNLQSQV